MRLHMSSTPPHGADCTFQVTKDTRIEDFGAADIVTRHVFRARSEIGRAAQGQSMRASTLPHVIMGRVDQHGDDRIQRRPRPSHVVGAQERPAVLHKVFVQYKKRSVGP